MLNLWYILGGLRLLQDVWAVIRLSGIATIRAIFAEPSLIFRPRDIRRIMMAEAWKSFGPGIDGNSKEVKTQLITPHARGVVLDIGAGTLACLQRCIKPVINIVYDTGHGHTALYLDPAKVTKYVAVEPNTAMHPFIRINAEKAGFTEESSEHTLVVLSYGAEQASLILSALGGQKVDTIVSILTLCSIPSTAPSATNTGASRILSGDKPSPKVTLNNFITTLLAPGGAFLFFEHVRNPRPDVARIQRAWGPLWAMVFDGCIVGRPTDVWVHELGVVGDGGDNTSALWSEGETKGLEGEPEEHLFWHSIGKFVRKKD